ncbi:hypothetical protein AQUCO_02600383v1 [Aquilegia coerulea]|uniref:Uncharacterized protein n=1 Tax=Aquilegia coerulea TaxID=218851 RepID=A0A2G5D8Q7_AQUCA|nr:hypothetical protein AQUCO_02600383v1 [Aquilegia coerulea]
METVKEKVSNAAAVAKEKAKLYEAKVQEKAETATAKTREEKELAHERRKAKEAEAKMELHQTKAEIIAERLNAKHAHMMQGHEAVNTGSQGQQHMTTAPPVTSSTALPVTSSTAPPVTSSTTEAPFAPLANPPENY